MSIVSNPHSKFSVEWVSGGTYRLTLAAMIDREDPIVMATGELDVLLQVGLPWGGDVLSFLLLTDFYFKYSVYCTVPVTRSCQNIQPAKGLRTNNLTLILA